MPAKKEETLLKKYKNTISEINRLQKRIMRKMNAIRRKIQINNNNSL